MGRRGPVGPMKRVVGGRADLALPVPALKATANSSDKRYRSASGFLVQAGRHGEAGLQMSTAPESARSFGGLRTPRTRYPDGAWLRPGLGFAKENPAKADRRNGRVWLRQAQRHRRVHLRVQTASSFPGWRPGSIGRRWLTNLSRWTRFRSSSCRPSRAPSNNKTPLSRASSRL